MAFQREKQSVSASELLQAIADGEDIKLTGCTITGVLDINRIFEPDEKFNTERLLLQHNQDCRSLALRQSIVFDKCTFEENAVFSGPWSEPDSLCVRFESDVIFNSSVFKGQARFRSAEFCGDAGFDGCTFGGVVTFKNATFHKEAKFRTVEFNGYCLLGNAVFMCSVRFTNTHFVRGANFSSVKFIGPTDFSGVFSSSRSVPQHDGVYFGRRRYGDDESFWRFVKQSAQEAGYYQMSGESFYNERSARLRGKFLGPDYDDLSVLKKLARLIFGLHLLPELLFGKLLFGYGERPVRVLVASALIIIVCAFVYSRPEALMYRDGPAVQTSFARGLYFSTITFTTLGYGDLYPAGTALYRTVAMMEAVAGGCLMALFVVCLAKRFSRG